MSNKKDMVVLKSFSTEYEANDWIRSQGLVDYKDEVYVVKTESLKSVGISGAIKSGRYHVVAVKGLFDKIKQWFSGKRDDSGRPSSWDMNKTPSPGVYAPASKPVPPAPAPAPAPAPSSAADPKPSITDPDSANVGWDVDWHAVADKVPGAKPRPPQSKISDAFFVPSEPPKKEAPTAPPRVENFDPRQGYLPDLSSRSAKAISLKTLKSTAKGLSNKFNQLYQEQVLKSIVEKSVMSVLKDVDSNPIGDTPEDGTVEGIHVWHNGNLHLLGTDGDSFVDKDGFARSASEVRNKADHLWARHRAIYGED
jgi:hypothetical protein